MFKDSFILEPSSYTPPFIKCGELIIKSILDSTLFFNKGPYDNLIKSQMTSQESDEIYDEDKPNKKILEYLEKNKR